MSNKNSPAKAKKKVVSPAHDAGGLGYEGKITCYDCGKPLKVENDEVLDGKFLAYEVNGEKLYIFKCDECFSVNKTLTNYQETECYSRVVGYIRPVKNWNPGAREQYGDRKMFDIEKSL